MATVTYIKEKKQHLGAMVTVMKYCAQEQKTWDEQSQQKLVSGINCDGGNAITEFLATKAAYNKMDGINFYQYVQSFHPRENITPQQVHEIARAFAEKAWPGYEVQICTHCDAQHIHSHFVINSVSFVDGRKLRQDPSTLRQLRSISDKICKEHNLSILPPYQKGGRKLSPREYRAARRNQSWKFRLMYDINKAMEKSCSREDFIKLMNRSGYKVLWTEERKHITFSCPSGMKCRCNKLHDDKYLKENIEYEFTIREQYLAGRLHPEQRSGDGRNQRSTLPASRVHSAERMVGERNKTAGAGRGVPAYPVPPDQPAVHPEGVGADAGSAAAASASGEAGHSGNHPQHTATGWENERKVFYRYIENALRQSQGYGRYGPAFGAAHSEEGRQGICPVGSAVGAGLRAASALGGLIDSNSDDPDEQRKKIGAQQAASNLGAVIGLAAGIIGALAEKEKEEEQSIQEEEEFKEFLAEMDKEYEYEEEQNWQQTM
ncbi:MAG: relaxase/mobilization nuclease domain-containing protein [Oscillospiraceae bacterium]|nr:relaxase/mobilization nuclease domain-containing protein [Oscillospiraceae bacterium]